MSKSLHTLLFELRKERGIMWAYLEGSETKRECEEEFAHMDMLIQQICELIEGPNSDG